MRRGVMSLTIVLLLLGLVVWARPTESQVPLPTPRGQLGGREPLGLTPALPFPAPTVPATATPPAGTPVASPPPIGAATPVSGVTGESLDG